MFLTDCHVGKDADWYFNPTYQWPDDGHVAFVGHVPTGYLHVPWWSAKHIPRAQSLGFTSWTEGRVLAMMDDVEKFCKCGR
ncbi:hypothetical protein N9L68_02300 [bacterium]|nr:hypothetical protein [bacterium]